MQHMFPNKDAFIRAYEVVQRYVHRTPIMTCRQIDEMMGNGNRVFFKCENLQKGGAFKVRGACNAIQKMSEEEKSRGVVTYSSGNHGICISLMAREFGSKATVVLPGDAPMIKRQIIESLGAEMIFVGRTKQEMVDALQRVVEERGATAIPNDNHWDVVAGQGTVMMEMQEQLGETKLDYILVPIGSGSLCAGAQLSTRYFYPECKVIGVEPTLEQDTYMSLKSGKLEPQLKSNSVCDGCRVHVGSYGFEVMNQTKLHDIYLVDDVDSLESMFLVWEKLKMFIEVSSALPLAAILNHKQHFHNANIGIVLTGGNVDFNTLLPYIQKRYQ